MLLRHSRRRLMLLLFCAGPTLGWLLLDDRGPFLGLVVGTLTVLWLTIEEKQFL